MKKSIKKIALLYLPIAFFAMSSVAMALPPIVTVSAQHYGGLVVYTYRLINNTPYEIHAVKIGYDTLKGDDPNSYDDKAGFQLLSDPSGMIDQSFPPGSVTSPAQWGALSIGAEDVPVHAIEWSVIDDNSPRLAAGQTLTGMSIKLDKTDVSYVSGRATVYSGYPVAPISVPIQKLDTMPPVLTVTLNPATITAAQRGQMIPVTATITVKDDYDPAPEIKLVSIQTQGGFKPSDAPGALIGADSRSFQLNSTPYSPTVPRAYVLTFSATDASGNETRVSVPYLM